MRLKLEIALGIPASNEWKIPTHNSAAEGLKLELLRQFPDSHDKKIPLY